MIIINEFKKEKIKLQRFLIAIATDKNKKTKVHNIVNRTVYIFCFRLKED